MTQTKTQTTEEREAKKNYVCLKNLIKSEQIDNATALFNSKEMINKWRPLLHHTMLQRNCPVTTFLLDRIYEQGGMSDKDFETAVFKQFNGVSLIFTQRVKKLLTSGRFNRELARFEQLSSTVRHGIYSRTAAR